MSVAQNILTKLIRAGVDLGPCLSDECLEIIQEGLDDYIPRERAAEVRENRESRLSTHPYVAVPTIPGYKPTRNCSSCGKPKSHLIHNYNG
jgi:hypothetical protein